MESIKHSTAAAALIVAAVFFSSVLAPARTARAQGLEEAKERFKKGLMLVDEGDCKKAIVEFDASYMAFPAPSILYNMALCYDKLHGYAKAMEHYKKYLVEAKNIPDKKYKAIKERIGKLEKYLGTLRVSCDVSDAKVLVDGTVVGRTPMEEMYLETGEHTLAVQKEGYEDFSTTVMMISGKIMAITAPMKESEKSVAPAPAPAPEPMPWPTPTTKTDDDGKSRKTVHKGAFYGMLAGTLAFTVGAAVAGGLNVSNHNEFEDMKSLENPTEESRTKMEDLQDKGELYNNLFLGFTVVAGAAAITTVVLGVFTNFEKKDDYGFNVVPTGQGGMITFSGPLAF
ncbi:MAG: PEGA domain-containing protein [Pseudomonadota bacterium]